MEAAPPSYESAVTRSPWEFVAEYLPSNDLCSAILVCREWYRIYIPHLWGNPASHFGLHNDAVYVALTRFKWTLHWARLSTRQLTHTLHLPPAHAQAYNGPNADWLRITLQSLPRLQSLMVQGLPFFDHASLLALREQTLASKLYELRLLDASNCKNATPNGLAEVIQRLPALIYLDLSWTLPARDAVVISKLRQLRSLRILKLRGLSLKDDDLKLLTKSIGLRARSLDLRNNRISDNGVDSLLRECFLSSDERLALEQSSDGEGAAADLDGLPGYLKESLARIYRSAKFEDHLYRALSKGFITRLALEDAIDVGLTHLYVSNNQITVHGMKHLIETAKLYALDVGNPIPMAKAFKSPLARGTQNSVASPEELEVEKLAHPLATYASPNLTYLRINHAVITKEMPLGLNNQRTAQLSATITGLEALPGYVESSGNVEGFSIPLGESGTSPAYSEQLQEIERPTGSLNSLFASVMSLSVGDGSEPFEKDEPSPQSLGINRIRSRDSDTKESIRSVNSGMAGPSEESDRANPISLVDVRKKVVSTIVEERHRRLQIARSTSRHLHPATLPRLRTLVLSGIPSHTFSKDLSDRLIAFIRECAEETCLSNLLARVDYSAPLTRRTRSSYLKEYAKDVFSLDRIVLELEHATEVPTQSERRGSKGWNYRYNTKSVTEDADSEALWIAGEADFSFFVDEKGEDRDFETPSPISVEDTSYRCDTAAELIAYRKASRQKYEVTKYRDECSIHGYWNGKVEIVRPLSMIK